MNRQNSLPIGVFDSGVGGITVLAEIIKILPAEKYIYVADSANAPYGIKGCDCVRELSLRVARKLMEEGIKALVVACNTATSVAISHIREQFNIPVIGMEPALKPAVQMGNEGNILVMATPLTLKEQKFNNLCMRYNPNATIIPLPCPGLVELIEGEVPPSEIKKHLQELLKHVPVCDISTIVLGCTHYCFIIDEISETVGPDINIINGNAGTARHLRNLLHNENLLTTKLQNCETDNVKFITSGDSARIIPACKRLLIKSLDRSLTELRIGKKLS